MNTHDGYSKKTLNNTLVLLAGGGDHLLGNATGNIPLSNGTVNVNLNADLLDGYHASALLHLSGYYYIPGNSNNGSTKLWSKIGHMTFTGSWQQCGASLTFYEYESRRMMGELKFNIRTSSSKSTAGASIVWMNLTNKDFENSFIIYKTGDGTYDIYFVYPASSYNNVRFYIISQYDDGYLTWQNGSALTSTEPTYVDDKFVSGLTSWVGNARSATKLATSRTINGTSFDGTDNITTAKWGTARTITIGNTVKSVDGSQNVIWTLAEIGVDSTYVKLNPGAAEQTIRSSISSLSKGVINLWRNSGDHYTFLGFSNGTTETYLGGIGFLSQSDHNLYKKVSSNYYKIADASNITNPATNITTTELTIATIAGVNIKAKITVSNSAPTLSTTAKTIATIGGTAITASVDHTRTTIAAGTAGTSSATSGYSIAIPYVTMNAYGHVTGYGTHTHTISVGNFYRNLGGGNSVEITVNGDANTYYPIVIGSPSEYFPYQFVNITRTYSETAPDTWNTSTHKGGLSMAIFWNGSKYWDGNASGAEAFVVRLYQSYCTMVGGVGNSTAGKVVWLRGGGAKYHIFSMNGRSQDVTVYDGTTNSSTYTDSANHSFTPKTTPDTITVRWPGYAEGATTATKLTTARTINGTSFNGTDNIVTSYWGTARTLTIGNTSKSVDGSANVSWTLSEIGAATSGHTHYWANVQVSSSANTETTPQFGSIGINTDVNTNYKLNVSGASKFNGIINIDSNAMGAVSHINFNRASYNYINIPTGGIFAVSVNGASSTNSKLAVDVNSVFPGANDNSVSLGTSLYRWKKLHIGTTDSYGSSTQPIYWNAGVPKAISHTLGSSVSSGSANRMAFYSASNTISGATTIYATNTALTVNGTASPANGGNFQVKGISTMQKILPEVTETYDLGSAVLRWRYGYFSNQINVSVETGTAPFYIQSTTKVSNLNADLLDEEHEYTIRAYPKNSGDVLFSSLPYLESDISIIKAPVTSMANAPFSKCFGPITANSSFYSDFIAVKPGDVLYGEVWAYRASGATGTAGTLYYGINRYDRYKKPITSNTGCIYFVASGLTVSSDGVWHKYSGTTTIPTTHTAHTERGNTSDGQGVYYIKVKVLVNYNSGTIPTYIGGIQLSKTFINSEDNKVYINGLVLSVTNPNTNITTTEKTIATIAGNDIKAKITVSNSAPTLSTTAKTIATIGGTTITASVDHVRTTITAGTAGTYTDTSGATISIPYVTMNAYGHVTGYGTRFHTISGFSSDTHTHTFSEITDKILTDSGNNEFNFIDQNISGIVWINKRNSNGNNTNTVTEYDFGKADGSTSYASLKAEGYIKNGSNDSYVLLGGGGHRSLDDFLRAKRWTATIKGATWSRICHVTQANSGTGSSFILNIKATRSNVVYNHTYLINTHHLNKAIIVCLNGSRYTATEFKIRCESNTDGAAYVDIYDLYNSATASTTLKVYCTLYRLKTGTVTDYTSFTDGSTVDTGYTATDLVQTNCAITTDSVLSKYYYYDSAYRSSSYLLNANGGVTATSTFATSGHTHSVSNSNPSVLYGQTMTVGTVMGTNLLFTLTDRSGTANFTDGTELLTSYANDSGFSTSGYVGYIYRRPASSMWNYIKSKTSCSVSTLSSSKATNLTAAITVNGVTSASKTLTNVYSVGLASRTSIVSDSDVLVHYKNGGATVTAASYTDMLTTAAMGNSTSVYYPYNASVNGNAQLLRILWGSTFWKELFFSPNNKYMFYRGRIGDTILKWHIIPMLEYPNTTGTLATLATLGSATKPVYISEGKFVECDNYPSGGTEISSVSIGAGTVSNTVKVTVNTKSSTNYTIPYATSAATATTANRLYLNTFSSATTSLPNSYNLNLHSNGFKVGTLINGPSENCFDFPSSNSNALVGAYSFTFSLSTAVGANHTSLIIYSGDVYIKNYTGSVPFIRKFITNYNTDTDVWVRDIRPISLIFNSILGDDSPNRWQHVTSTTQTVPVVSNIRFDNDGNTICPHYLYTNYGINTPPSYINMSVPINTQILYKAFVCLLNPNHLDGDDGNSKYMKDGQIIYIEMGNCSGVIGVAQYTSGYMEYLGRPGRLFASIYNDSIDDFPFCDENAYIDNMGAKLGNWYVGIKVKDDIIIDSEGLGFWNSLNCFYSTNKSVIKLMVTKLNRGVSEPSMHAEYVYRILS